MNMEMKKMREREFQENVNESLIWEFIERLLAVNSILEKGGELCGNEKMKDWKMEDSLEDRLKV
jgi:hypothetical protein